MSHRDRLSNGPTGSVFELEGFPRDYFHTIDHNESDIPVRTFVPFDHNMEINKIFRFKAWRNVPFNQQIDSRYPRLPVFDMPVGFYERLVPALQLLTILIKRARPFFVHIYRGRVIHRAEANYIDPDFKPDENDEFAYDVLQEQLVDDILITYIPGILDRSRIRTINNGLTGPVQDSNFLVTRNRVPHIGIAQEIFLCFAQSDFYTKPLWQREAQLAHLAQLLLHEYAHAVWYSRNYEDRYEYSQDVDWINRLEPTFYPAQWAELGYTVCIMLFGFCMDVPWPLNKRWPLLDGSDGLRATYHNKHDYNVDVVLRQLSRETVHSLFNKLTWAPMADGSISKLDVHFLDITGPEYAATPAHYPSMPTLAPSPPQDTRSPPAIVDPAGYDPDDMQDGTADKPFLL